jgi:hypothetical protein
MWMSRISAFACKECYMETIMASWSLGRRIGFAYGSILRSCLTNFDTMI